LTKTPTYYTTHQVSRLLGVALNTVVNWADQGKLPSHRTPGGHRRISEPDLVAFARDWKMPLDDALLARHGRGRRVLVIEPDPDARETVALMLQQGRGLDVVQAASAFEAGVLFARRKPDALVLDARLPGMPGEELAELLAAGRLTVPVVALVSRAAAEAARSSGRYAGVVPRPLDLDELLGAVEAVLE
jgi:excisionase family DNA binding protein